MAIPKYHESRYFMNPEIGYFEKQAQRETFKKLPFELKVEPTQDERIKANGASDIIRGRVKDGKYTFFTGLIPAGFKDLFIGNDYEFINKKKVNSLVIFKFYSGGAKLAVYYFNRFNLYPKKRAGFVAQFVKMQKDLKRKQAVK